MKIVAALIWIILGATLAGVGLAIVVATPQLAAQSMKFIPWAALAGFVIAIPFSILLASRIKGRLPKA
ncbi:hypothetical protein GJ654_02070 [Rhodoblastus acidophilus]|uniref:CTP synthetase n=1 Tax=Rhodoblastus acidophilus TaxID=1074 RepID=A0A6N8DIZ6_RHOAC|nr:hypothetical protein [Rhodoblastus acidophilus]MCW2272869.1 flagellar biosynthesis protein FliQ [Rhodoblastus acidophilus]MTV29776.1 hypothetical protein [Rhodoblastus acidophilus]